MTNGSRSRLADPLLNLGISVGAILLFAGFLEMLLRSTHLMGAQPSWTTPDPVLGYRFWPGAAYRSVKESDHPITGRINRFGWRDQDWTLRKEAGSYRIAVLGDSFVEALQVEADSTFLRLAQSRLTTTTGIPIEMMNFGRSGLTQSEELLILRRDVLEFTPDMVLVFFFPGNDIADIDRRTATTLQRPFFLKTKDKFALDTTFAFTSLYRFRTHIDAIKRHSALISLIIERYLAAQRGPSARAANGLDEYLSLCTRHPNPVYEQNYALNKRLLLEMVHLLSARGIAFGIVAIPLPAYLPDMERRFLTFDPTFDKRWYEKDLRSFAAANRIEFLGLQDAFSQAYDSGAELLNWRNLGHWTYAGHRVVAQSIDGWLGPIIRTHLKAPETAQ
jgi:lysophospholipase L1-like esterase